MDRAYEHDDYGMNDHVNHANGHRRPSQRQLEKAPEDRLPHSVARNRSYVNSNGGSTVRGVPRVHQEDDGGDNSESHTEDSLGAPGPAPPESKFTDEH